MLLAKPWQSPPGHRIALPRRGRSRCRPEWVLMGKWESDRVASAADAPRARSQVPCQSAAPDRAMHRAMMLLRLPGALREVLLGAQLPSRCRAFSSSSSTITTAATTSRTTTTTTTTTTATTAPQDPGPLRILFCGSDAFSIESLRALHAAQQQDPAFIEAIHVVHRPAKPTGRGLKTLREGNQNAMFLFSCIGLCNALLWLAMQWC